MKRVASKRAEHRERFRAIYTAEFPIGTRHGTRIVRTEPYFTEGRWCVDMLCDCGAVGPVPVIDLRNAKAQTCKACVFNRWKPPPDETPEEISESVLARFRRAEEAELNAKYVTTFARRSRPGATICIFCGSDQVGDVNGQFQCVQCMRVWEVS